VLYRQARPVLFSWQERAAQPLDRSFLHTSNT
jgi:hypothetical protein